MKSKTSLYKKYRRQRIKAAALYVLVAVGVFAAVFAVRVGAAYIAGELLINLWS